MLGITEAGDACDFFAKDVWLRGKIDAIVIRQPMAAIFDWKTGKKREDPGELELHAMIFGDV